MVVQAPFPARADTVMPGDLLGPFDGKAVDAVSGKPIAGAIVQVSWSFETGRGLTAPAGGSVQTVATDNEGKYEVENSAFFIHGRIHQGNKRAAVVLHTHMPYATALTSIQESTLSFVPKLVAVLLTFALTTPFVLVTLKDFTRELYGQIVQVGTPG